MGLSGSGSDVTSGDIQEVFSQANEPATPLATDEVATRVDRPTETAPRNVKKLVDLDRVGRKQRNGSMWEVTVHDVSIAPCRRTIERHGGEIRVESRPGAGSTVPVPLPRAGDADE